MPRTDTATKSAVRTFQAALAAEGHDISYTAARRIWAAAAAAPNREWTPVHRNDPRWSPECNGHLLIAGASAPEMSTLVEHLVHQQGESVQVVRMTSHEDGEATMPESVMERLLQPAESISDTMIVVLDGDLSRYMDPTAYTVTSLDLICLMKGGASTGTYLLTYTADPAGLSERIRGELGVLVLPNIDESAQGALGIDSDDVQSCSEDLALASYAVLQ